MGTRGYRLGRRQVDVDRTRSAILSAARQLVAELGPDSSVGRVAERAGVSRITVYNRFGTKAELLEALAADLGPGRGAKESGEPISDPSDDLMRRIREACAAWSSDPSLHRQLQRRPGSQGEVTDLDRALAERLAAYDRLRPGCSIKEAEDVIGILTSFPVFDRLHKSGRRSPSAVVEILERMASVFMVSRSSV